MNQNKISEVKEKLEKQKSEITRELQKFAEKDKNLNGDWDTKYPDMNTGVGSQQLEDAADEVTEYSTLLPIEQNLELRLRDIDIALDKIDKGTYGLCENCKREIESERLDAYPEARTCSKCQKEK